MMREQQPWSPDVAASGTGAPREVYIDGMRGWAALSVMLFHLFWEVFGHLLPAFRSRHLSFVLGGHLDVCIFFVLSGDALATPFLSTGRMSIVVKTALRRYTRLAIPIAMAVFVVYLLLVTGLARNHAAAAAGFRPDWLGAFLNFPPDAGMAARYATFGVFAPSPATPEYVPFLWTMPVELLGSVLVFVFLFAFPWLRRPLVLACAVAAFLLSQQSYLGLFLVGIALALLRVSGRLDAIASRPAAAWVVGALLAITYATYCYVLPLEHRDWDRPVAALVVVLCSLCLPLRRFFERGVSRFLGRISFALYLVHFGVIVSLTSAGAIYLQKHGLVGYPGALLVGGASALVSLALAVPFTGAETRLQSIVNAALDRWVLVPSTGPEDRQPRLDGSEPEIRRDQIAVRGRNPEAAVEAVAQQVFRAE